MKTNIIKYDSDLLLKYEMFGILLSKWLTNWQTHRIKPNSKFHVLERYCTDPPR